VQHPVVFYIYTRWRNAVLCGLWDGILLYSDNRSVFYLLYRLFYLV